MAKPRIPPAIKPRESFKSQNQRNVANFNFRAAKRTEI